MGVNVVIPTQSNQSKMESMLLEEYVCPVFFSHAQKCSAALRCGRGVCFRSPSTLLQADARVGTDIVSSPVLAVCSSV
mgnify:CR=1 FL=1